MKEETQDISDKRLALIRRLIDLAYTYSDKELFHQKFMEAININSLKDSEVVEMGDNVLQISCTEKLSDDEMEMYCLMEQGFTAQEIAVIYKEKSLNAVYIKRHRLKETQRSRLAGGCTDNADNVDYRIRCVETIEFARILI